MARPGSPPAGGDAAPAASGCWKRLASKTAPTGGSSGFDPREGPYSCSGTSLETPSDSIVLTAGHCVLEAGSWGTDIVFVPAFDHEARPFGDLPRRRRLRDPRPGERFGNSDFDVAALRVEPNELGTSATVGRQGLDQGPAALPIASLPQIFGDGRAEGEGAGDEPGRALGSDRIDQAACSRCPARPFPASLATWSGGLQRWPSSLAALIPPPSPAATAPPATASSAFRSSIPPP